MATNLRSSSSRFVRGSSSRNNVLQDSKTQEIDTPTFVITCADNTGKYIKFPQKFTDRWGSQIEDKVLLDTKDGKSWVISVERRNGSIWLGKGWVDFRKNYKFRIFDTIFFKYKGTSNFAVYIFNGFGMHYGWEYLGPFDTPSPFFKQIGSSNYVNKFVLPDEFTLVYAPDIANPLTLVGTDDDQEWLVKWIKIDNSIWLTEGWANFALNYNLRKRDYVIFKPRDFGKMLVRVVHNDSGMVENFGRLTSHDTMDYDDQLRELWTATISQATTTRTLALYVPARVVRRCLQHKPNAIPVVLPYGDLDVWHLNWSPGRNDECYIGDGWYQFKKFHDLKPGDHLRFSRRGSEMRFIVEFV